MFCALSKAKGMIIKMKKLLSLILVASMLASLSACTGTTTPETPTETPAEAKTLTGTGKGYY